jgi:hypothetical protein
MDFPIVDLFDDDLSTVWLLKYFNLYSGTVFEGKHFRPAQAILLLRSVCKGEPTATIAREIGVARQTVHDMRKAIQANAEKLQPAD